MKKWFGYFACFSSVEGFLSCFCNHWIHNRSCLQTQMEIMEHITLQLFEGIKKICKKMHTVCAEHNLVAKDLETEHIWPLSSKEAMMPHHWCVNMVLNTWPETYVYIFVYILYSDAKHSMIIFLHFGSTENNHLHTVLWAHFWITWLQEFNQKSGLSLTNQNLVQCIMSASEARNLAGF